MQVFPNLNTISQSFPAILLDAYGVFWGGNKTGLLPGAKEAMKSLVDQGKIVGVLSNTTQLASQEIDKIQRHGLEQGVHFHFLLTAGEIARSLFISGELPFATSRKRFWLLGEHHPHFASHHPIFQDSVFKETPHLEEADFIYLSVPHIKGVDQTDPHIFREQLIPLKKSGLPMVCANPDHFAHEGYPPRSVVRQGSLAAIYEELGGQVFYIGKPYSMAYAAALKAFAPYKIMQASEVLMIGDTPETDIRGARQFGMQTALLTQTGMMADRIAKNDLKKAIGDLYPQDIPNFFLERLAYHEL